MKGNIYHLIKYRIAEIEKEEMDQRDAHLPYQALLKFFYDVRSIINSE
jgi:hypothetical protein